MGTLLAPEALQAARRLPSCLKASKMTKVAVDAKSKLVTVEGGCRLGDMDKAQSMYHGLDPR